MELKEKICKSYNDLPTVEELKSTSRGVKYKVIFKNEIRAIREEIGEQWKKELPKFQIGIHTIKDEISVVKLITDEEILEHQDFFEKCAKDYGMLGERLITEFARHFGVKINPAAPLETLNPYGKTPYEQSGKFGEWKYYFHGIHCAFTNLKNHQHIEVPLTYGLEFGELDPYCFTGFIKSTPEYQPLPVEIYEDYADGKRILEVMLNLGKFEKILSNIRGQEGIIVKDRPKVEIKEYKEGIWGIIRNVDFQKQEPSFWNKLKKMIIRQMPNEMQ